MSCESESKDWLKTSHDNCCFSSIPEPVTLSWKELSFVWHHLFPVTACLCLLIFLLSSVGLQMVSFFCFSILPEAEIYLPDSNFPVLHLLLSGGCCAGLLPELWPFTVPYKFSKTTANNSEIALACFQSTWGSMVSKPAEWKSLSLSALPSQNLSSVVTCDSCVGSWSSCLTAVSKAGWGGYHCPACLPMCACNAVLLLFPLRLCYKHQDALILEIMNM